MEVVNAPNSADNSSADGDSSQQSSTGQAQQALDFTDNSVSETSSDRGTMGTKDESTSQEVSSSNATESEDEDGPRRMTVKWLKEFFKENWRTYYRTFELNEKLYLHFKGFNKFENMHLFPELKCLYFEGNGLNSMKGLEECKELRTLNIHENILTVMEGM
jgi:hypothetical protein